MMSETVNVPVAIISSAIARRLVAVRPALGAANPGLPVSSAMVVILESFCATITIEAGAGSAGFGRGH